MTVSEQLQAARKLIEHKEDWAQFQFEDDNGRICASEALRRTNAADHTQYYGREYVGGEAYNALSKAMGVDDFSVSTFNDSHSHAEVLAAFDQAIATAQAREERPNDCT